MEGPIQPFNKHKNLQVDNEKDINMSPKNYEATGYGRDLSS